MSEVGDWRAVKAAIGPKLMAVEPVPEPPEIDQDKLLAEIEAFESRKADEARRNDPLYGIAAALRALTWEQVEEMCGGAGLPPAKLIAWAKTKMGEPEVIEPTKKERRV